MAATGLPIPKNDNTRTEVTPIVSGGTGSAAAAWTSIAQSGEKIASESAHYLDREIHAAHVAKIADFEVSRRTETSEMRDKFALDPAGFKNWSESTTAGVIEQVPSWMLPHAKQFLSREHDRAYDTILGERRSNDKRLEVQSITARSKMADDDVMSIASNGKLSTPEGQAAVQTYKGVLDSAVSTGLMAPDHAQLLTEDLTTRAHGTVVRNDVERVYREKGFEAAREHLNTTLDEFGGAYRIKDQIRQKTLGWLRSEESGLKGERDAIGKEWAAAKGQIATLDPAVLQDMQQRAYERGAYKVGDDIQAHTSALAIVRNVRQLPQADQMRVLAGGSLDAKLVQSESGGDPTKVNPFGYVGSYQFGAPRLKDLGVYTPGAGENLAAWSKTPANAPGKWTGTFNIPGFPDVKTMADFKANPDAQKAVYGQHQQRTDQEIESFGLGGYVGQTVGGVPITRDGLRAAIHLGGASGVQKMLASGGSYNPADANGTTLLDYARLGASNASPGSLTGSRAGFLALGILKKDMTQDLGKKITDLRGAIDKTEFPPMEEIGALGAQVHLLGTEEQKRQVAEMAAQAEYGRKFAQLPRAQRDELVTRWREKLKLGASQYERHLADTVQNANTKVTEAWSKDPYDAAARYSEGIPALPAIEWGSPTVGNVLAAKVQQQNTIRADQGLPAFSVLRPGEAQQLAQTLVGGDPRAGSAIMQTLAQNLPADMYRATVADPAIRTALDGMVRSYDPDRMNTAFSVMDRSYRDDPLGFKATFKEEGLKRLQTWQAHKDSLTPVQMAEYFKLADDPARAAARGKLLEEAETKVKGMTPAKIANDMGSIADRWVPFVNQAAPTDALSAQAMAAEYETIFKERYIDTNANVDKAKEQTIERLKVAGWGPSAVVGGSLMKHPPERYYPEVDGSRDWMKDDLRAAAEEIRGAPMWITRDVPGSGAQASEQTFTVKVISDARTEADVAARRPPTYVMQITDLTTGRMDIPLDANGRPRRMGFDPSTAQESARDRFRTKRDVVLNAPDPFAGRSNMPGDFDGSAPPSSSEYDVLAAEGREGIR
jgi:hypothetical protein